jgi:hypothetical protein
VKHNALARVKSAVRRGAGFLSAPCRSGSVMSGYTRGDQLLSALLLIADVEPYHSRHGHSRLDKFKKSGAVRLGSSRPDQGREGPFSKNRSLTRCASLASLR